MAAADRHPAGAARVADSTRWSRAPSGPESTRSLRDGVVFGLGVVALTALWLVPLTLALGPRATPFALFLGSVNQGALTFALEAPPRGIVVLGLCALWIPLAIAVANRPRVARLIPPLPSPRSPRRSSCSCPRAPRWPINWRSNPSSSRAWLALDVEFGSLFLYLPMLCAWCTLLILAARSRRGIPPPLEAWFLLVGTLAALALFPRADNAHAMLAGAPLLVLSALVLHRLHARLTTGGTRLGSAAAFFALLVLPVAALAPHLYARYLALAHPEPIVSHDRVRRLRTGARYRAPAGPGGRATARHRRFPGPQYARPATRSSPTRSIPCSISWPIGRTPHASTTSSLAPLLQMTCAPSWTTWSPLDHASSSGITAASSSGAPINRIAS